MNVFSEIEIKSQKGTDFIIEMLIEFATAFTEWVYDSEKSDMYSQGLLGQKGCILLYKKSEFIPGFAFCEKKEGLFYIANIVPKETEQIPLKKYNALSKQFYDDFRNWKKGEKYSVTISISKTDLELEDIITADVPRGHFQTYLNLFPLSYHPLDIERLDKFICSASRYSRKPINWIYLGEFLRKKKKWPEKDIQWCINRIETGLQIIKVYRKY